MSIDKELDTLSGKVLATTELRKFEVITVQHGNVVGYQWARDVAHAWHLANRSHKVPVAVVPVYFKPLLSVGA
jgi:hypothetical protein